jgi:hypothetical protein
MTARRVQQPAQDPEPGSNPWDRKPDETDNAWVSFLAFRDMAYPDGPFGSFAPRNVQKLADRLGMERSGLARYSSAHGWPVRAAAYDRHLDRMALQVRGKALEHATKRHIRLFEKASEIIESDLAKWAGKANEDPNVPISSLKETIDALEKLVKGERLILGATTDNPGSGGAPSAAGWDLDSLSLEELERLNEIRMKARAPEPKPVDPGDPEV